MAAAFSFATFLGTGVPSGLGVGPEVPSSEKEIVQIVNNWTGNYNN